MVSEIGSLDNLWQGRIIIGSQYLSLDIFLLQKSIPWDNFAAAKINPRINFGRILFAVTVPRYRSSGTILPNALTKQVRAMHQSYKAGFGRRRRIPRCD